MSIRFTLFFFSCIVAVHVYFLNAPPPPEQWKGPFIAFLLTQFLNQSDILLLLGYVLIKFWKRYNKIAFGMILIYVLYLFIEFGFNLFKPYLGSNGYFTFNYLIMILIRLVYIYIFLRIGVDKTIKNQIVFCISLLLICAFDIYLIYYSGFVGKAICTLFLFTQIVYFYTGFRVVLADTKLDKILIAGIIISSIVDSLYLYDLYIAELSTSYTWIRLCCIIGEFMLAHVILKHTLGKKLVD
jgi:hypothetical protein